MEFRNHLSHELAVPPYAEQQIAAAAAAADNRAALRKAMDQLSATRASGAGEEADAVSDDGKDLHRLMAKPAMAGGSGPTWLNGAILQQHGLGQYGDGRFLHLQASSASPGGGRGGGGGHWFPRPPPVLQRSVSEEEVPMSTESAVAAAISSEVGAGGGGSRVRAERGEAEGGSGVEAAEGSWQNARYKAEILAHPLYEQLLSAHVACLRIATPVDQLPRIDAQLSQSQQVVSKYSALGGGGQMMSVDDRELDQFMTHYVFLLSSFKEQLQQHVRVHAMEAVMACWELEQSLQSLTGVSPGEGTGATMSDDEDDQDQDSDTNLFDGSLDGPDSMGFGPLVPTETERSLMERVRQELKHELKQGYKDKIVDIRDEILRKRRAGKLPGDSTSTLKAWWQSHSKWPYPTEDDKARLVQETGLQLKQINNWFINQRKRNWHSNSSSSSSTLKSKRKSEAVNEG
ncbi:homeobox protein knotted-1-like 13 isoform X1 [Zingiber officinale]|uniref:homeobox protein knotted-1-like 13 isoform X1 n=1 Tax=Zingiber officinale TaxID=94328 RepID=UPI001C4C7344|nr:homeobox protein knotted-1-like 13 isoform X1 [Zingiber officinale]